MAFDGAVIAAINNELNNSLINGRIIKVAQPEKDALLLTIKKEGLKIMLLISVNPSLPLIYLTEDNMPSPAEAPSFCMLLRKHILNGKIISISQPSMERVIKFEIEHFDEMGDVCTRTLMVELMGKHSNIILTSEESIMDSIKHVNSMMSSVREVLPGKNYFIPFSEKKADPYTVSKETFYEKIFTTNDSVCKSLYMNITGLSPSVAEEISYRADVDSQIAATALTDAQKECIYNAFVEVMDIIKAGDFTPCIIYENDEPIAYTPFIFKIYAGMKSRSYDSISKLLYDYYAQKQNYNSIRQKTSDIRQVVTGLLNKDNKKYDLQLKQIKDTEKKERYRLYGELLTAYGYNTGPGATYMKAEDYNTGEEINIPLDPTLSAIDNGKKYFDKYAKLKRTEESLSKIILDTKEEIMHLESILASLDIIRDAADIDELKNELRASGYIKAGHAIKGNAKKKQKNIKGSPLHFLSKDGFDIYVGKNNIQNEYISFELAAPLDWWFHAKNIPGSHVIIKADGKDVSDQAFNDAARLAAFYSKAGGSHNNGNVEIDYVQRKFLKKTPGGKCGFVIYHTNYSMSASTDISDIREIK